MKALAGRDEMPVLIHVEEMFSCADMVDGLFTRPAFLSVSIIDARRARRTRNAHSLLHFRVFMHRKHHDLRHSWYRHMSSSYLVQRLSHISASTHGRLYHSFVLSTQLGHKSTLISSLLILRQSLLHKFVEAPDSFQCSMRASQEA